MGIGLGIRWSREDARVLRRAPDRTSEYCSGDAVLQADGSTEIAPPLPPVTAGHAITAPWGELGCQEVLPPIAIRGRILSPSYAAD